MLGVIYLARNSCCPHKHKETISMKNPLDSIAGTIIAGFVLTFVLYLFASGFLPLGGA